MSENKDIINFSKDKKMVTFSDRLLGYSRLIEDMNETRGRLSRQMINYVKKKYGVNFDTHVIDCVKQEIKPRGCED